MKKTHLSAYLALLFLLVITPLTFFSSQKSTPTYQGKTLDQLFKICGSIPHGSTQDVWETTRLFVNLPEAIYPYKNRKLMSQGATMGMVSNGEGIEPYFAKTKKEIEAFYHYGCFSHYYEFDGTGVVSMGVKSAQRGFPDYFIHFYVYGD